MHDEHQESPNTSSIPKPTNGAGNLPPDPKRATKPDWLSRAIERGSKRFLSDETGATIDLVGQEIDRLARRITSDRPDEKERATAAIVDAWLVHFAAGETALRSRIAEAFAAAEREAEAKPKLRAATVAKLFELFEKDTTLVALVARNAMSLEIAYTRPPPWKLGRKWTAQLPMVESDITRARAWFETRHRLRVSDRELTAVLAAQADESRFHPVREYLEALAWDGTARLGTWLSTYLGAVAEGETDDERARIEKYFAAVGTRFLISAVARAYEPGCKVDTMLILEGPQGAQKSTALRALAKSWFSDMSIDIGNKDTYLVMRKAWIYEHAELDGITRREAGEVKAFLSRASDHFRAPYAREAAEQPRSLVFAGTVNDSAYLKDPTGSRRYWIVPVGTIDLEALRRDVDQLWAEAVHLYKQGEQWWLTREEEETAETLRGPREIESPLMDSIDYFLANDTPKLTAGGERYVTPAYVISNGLKIKDATKLTKLLQAEVTAALVKLGWKRGQRRIRVSGEKEAKLTRCFVKAGQPVED